MREIRRFLTFAIVGVIGFVVDASVLYLGIYVAVLGSAGAWLAREDGPAFELWQGLNLWMALVHYAYDGMIWKLRRPETSRALGADISPPRLG